MDLTIPAVDRIVQLSHAARLHTFRIDPDPPLAFWRVESEGRVYRSPLRVLGDEQPAFFRELAQVADRETWL
jgi:hypothetical protein